MYNTRDEPAARAGGGDSKRRVRMNLLFPLLIILAVLIFTLMDGGGAIVSQIDETMLGVGSAHDTAFVRLSDIVSVELVSGLERGEQLSGSDDKAVTVGVYRNESCGEYSLYAYNKTGIYIVVHHRDGVLVFNAGSVKETEALYRKLSGILQ